MSENPDDVVNSLRAIRNILAVFLAILLLYLLKILSGLIVPLFFALFFAIMLQPLVDLFRKRFSLNTSVLITTILSVIVVLGMCLLLYNTVSALVENREDILAGISQNIVPLINKASRYTGFELKPGELRGYVSQIIPSEQLLSLSGTFINAMSGFAAELFMSILYFAGLLGAITNHEKVINYLMGRTASKEHSRAAKTFLRIKGSIAIYIKVKTIVSLITGAATGIICLLFEIPYALLWGFLAFVLNYIPYIGSLVAIIPPFIIGSLAASNLSEIVLLFVCLEGVQVIMGNIVEPKMTADSLSINTVTVLFSLVFWAFLWGIAGMLLAVPLTFLIKVILEQVSDAEILVRLMDKKTGKQLG